MPRFTYMNYPFHFYRNYSRIPPHFPSVQANNFSKDIINSFEKSSKNSNHVNDNRILRNFEQKNKSNKNTDEYLFDLFGLKIYSDDVLLVSLIYFLYSENVKDDGLFLVLVLLLLS